MSLSDGVRESLRNRIYDINEKDFESVATDVWSYQYQSDKLYKSYCNLLGFSSLHGKSISEIPFLPIQMFRDHIVKSGEWEAETIFRSSGTTGVTQSEHHIRDRGWYHKNAEKTFKQRFGKTDNFTWIALLPSYMEREDSSLIDMVHHFMQMDAKVESGFFTTIDSVLIKQLEFLSHQNRATILIGVSFALLDLFEKFHVPVWDNLMIIETGGMKGRGPEITREELHVRLRRQKSELKIASEYGMTELLSQAYLTVDHFIPGPAMRVFTRDISDPFQIIKPGQRGVLNFIDLANLDTCSFIASEDIGVSYADGSFDVLGRLDQSDLRGCNLLYT